MNNCIFPALPIPVYPLPGSDDTRHFKVGEPVCLRNQEGGDITSGTYVRPHIHPENRRVFTQVIRSDVGGHQYNRMIHWIDVGKIVQPVSPTAVNVVARSSPLPPHLASVIKKYGGKRSRTAKHNSASRKKLKSRRRSRRH